MIIDRDLAATGAITAVQFRAAVFAVSEWRFFFRPAFSSGRVRGVCAPGFSREAATASPKIAWLVSSDMDRCLTNRRPDTVDVVVVLDCLEEFADLLTVFLT